MKRFERLAEKHKLFRRMALIWAIGLITWTTLRVFEDLALITGPVAAALGSVVGILTVVVGFYQYSRGKEPGRKGNGEDI